MPSRSADISKQLVNESAIFKEVEAFFISLMIEMPFVVVKKPWVTEFFNIRTKIRCGGRETKDPHDLDVSLVNLTLIFKNSIL